MATRSYARIVSGVVAEVVALPATAAISAYYDTATAEWVECTLGAFVGTLKAIIATGTGTLPAQPATIP